MSDPPPAANKTKGVPLLQFTARNVDPSKCPFLESTISITLHRGSCVRLAGESGAGKTTLANYIAGLLPGSSKSNITNSSAAVSSAASSVDTTRCPANRALRNALGIHVERCEWDPTLRPGERVGMLFQQTTLLDALTVAGNVCVALEHCPSHSNNESTTLHKKQTEIKRILEAVGLDYARDGPKRPSELSGGMARRASLALQLAQQKHVIVLDEPFAGLDVATAVGVARELERVRRERGTALLLVSHEPHVVDVVMGRSDGRRLLEEAAGALVREEKEDGGSDGGGGKSSTVALTRRSSSDDTAHKSFRHPSLFGKDASHRFLLKLLDYFLYSLPLILLTFLAAGLAISMLSADILRRVDVTEPVMGIVDREVRPLLKMLTGEETINPLYMMMINGKVRGMLNTTIPPAKATLYAMGMAKLFVLEIGPLITALLLSGRIGGSYAGEVATMQATAQNKLLITLGIRPVVWTFVPSLMAAWLASPLLTAAGTVLALRVGEWVGPAYGIGDGESYRKEVVEAVFSPFRLRGAGRWKGLLFGSDLDDGGGGGIGGYFDVRCTFGDGSYTDTLIETLTHPVCFHLAKSVVFISIIMAVAEIAARRKADLTPRGVPKVITSSVVLGSLLVIFADWGFSQLLLKRQ